MEKITDGEEYSLCKTRQEFSQWCRDGGWINVAAFEKSTGVTFEEIKGKWFMVLANRVYFEEDPETGFQASEVEVRDKNKMSSYHVTFEVDGSSTEIIVAANSPSEALTLATAGAVSHLAKPGEDFVSVVERAIFKRMVCEGQILIDRPYEVRHFKR